MTKNKVATVRAPRPASHPAMAAPDLHGASGTSAGPTGTAGSGPEAMADAPRRPFTPVEMVSNGEVVTESRSAPYPATGSNAALLGVIKVVNPPGSDKCRRHWPGRGQPVRLERSTPRPGDFGAGEDFNGEMQVLSSFDGEGLPGGRAGHGHGRHR